MINRHGFDKPEKEIDIMLKDYNPDTVREVPERFRGIYSHAVEVSAPQKLLLLSGQIGVTPDGTTLPSFDEQCHQAMDNVEALLVAAGMSLNNVLRVTYYLTSAENLAALTKARRSRWGSSKAPAVTTLVVAALAGPELQVEIEVTAAL